MNTGECAGGILAPRFSTITVKGSFNKSEREQQKKGLFGLSGRRGKPETIVTNRKNA